MIFNATAWRAYCKPVGAAETFVWKGCDCALHGCGIK